MACFDLQHQYLEQPLFVDSSLAASRYSIAATQVLCCNYCMHQSRPAVSFFVYVHVWKWVFLYPHSGHYKELSLWWARVECIVVSYELLRHVWKIGFSLTALIDRVAWKIICAWLIGFSVYGPTPRLELPDGDSPHSYWHFDPMHDPEILVCITYVLLHSG